MAMKRITGILVMTITMTACGLLATRAAAQNTDAIDNARSVAKSLQQKQDVETNQALDAAGVSSPSSSSASSASSGSASSSSAKPAPGAPAPAVRPAVIPGASAAQPAAKAASTTPKSAAPVAKSMPAAKPVSSASSSSASAQNQLQKVNVVQSANSIQIEISSSEAVTPKVEKLKSPDRIAIELPETSDASSQNKISVGAGGVKGVRIGMDGKNPPTTSVVVDLDKALAYELTPGAAGKTILTLHPQGAMQAAAQPATKTATQTSAMQSKATSAPATAKVSSTPVMQSKPAPQPAIAQAKVSAPASAKVTVAKADPMVAKTVVAKADTAKVVASAPASKTETKIATAVPKAPAVEPAASADTSNAAKADDKKPEDKKWAMTGKRDPFFSPVVQQAGSGCSTGKKCLEIGNINLRGVVKSDNGFIAVVTNSLNKAYFLRENDPVFNGYVVKITGDSVTFQETVQDKLGKTFTREVVKRLFTPAV
jgi:Tfp pilus assembly protein PilP